MRIPHRVGRTAALLAAVALTPTPAALADTNEAPPDSTLRLSIHPLDSGEPPTVVTLECGPDGGTHPTSQRACESLRAVDGRFPKLPQLPAGCPRVYDPVRVVAKGQWEGHDVTFTDTHSNRCVAAAHTDNVFDF